MEVCATYTTNSVSSGIQVTKYAYIQVVYEASCKIMGENKSAGFYCAYRDLVENMKFVD